MGEVVRLVRMEVCSNCGKKTNIPEDYGIRHTKRFENGAFYSSRRKQVGSCCGDKFRGERFLEGQGITHPRIHYLEIKC